MSDLLARWDAFAPDTVAVVDAAGAHRWGVLQQASRRGAAGLRRDVPASEDGVGPRVGLLIDPGAAWLVGLMAIWRAGMVAVPLSPRHPDAEAAALLADAGATALLVDDANRRDLTKVRTLFLDSSSVGIPTPDEGRDGDVEEPLAMLLYTSGTTGRPKGVMLSHRALAHQAGLLREAWGLEGREALLHALPLHHMHGIAIAMFPCLSAGMEVHFSGRFEAERVWRAMPEVDCFMGVPTMYHRLLAAFDAASAETQDGWREAARSLGLATSGSAALPVTLAARWEALAGGLPLERYGMTEMGVGCSNPLAPAERRRGWVGRPLPTLETRIVNDDGEVVDDGPGMLQVRGPSLFDGYWHNQAATKDAFADGWFITGDIAQRDETGFLRLLGRRSVDILKSAGFKISALEIEEHLRDHAAVADVAVVGLDDPVYGQVVAAALVMRDEGAIDGLRPWLEERLAAYKVPRRWRPVESLPRNALGKVLKRDVVALFDTD